MNFIINALKLKTLNCLEVDSVEFSESHLKILKQKILIKEVFEEFYNSLIALDKKFFYAKGLKLELGAGTSFLKEIDSEVISTDVKILPWLDASVDAMNLPYNKGELRAIYGINCFHHFPDVTKFFDQANDLLPRGGGVILIEPFYGLLSRILYPRLFSTEVFNMKQTNWKMDKATAMKGANQALSYIVFKRDAKLFEELYPDLEIIHRSAFSNSIRYLLSGGLNFKQLIPSRLRFALKIIEFVLSPIKNIFALHWVVVIRKK